MLGEELADGLGELGAFTCPVVDAIALEVDGSGLSAGVIGADHLDRAAIAGAILFDDNDAIVGLLTGANARQTNHQHRVDPLKLECIQDGRQRSWTYPKIGIQGSRSARPTDAKVRTPKYRGFEEV